MHRLLPSFGLALLLVLSLGLKASINSAARAAPQGGGPDVAAFMQERGFSVDAPDPDNPLWISARAGGCRIHVADISPQGWQQALVAEQADGQQLFFVYAGKLYREQPVLLTTLDYYRQKLMRYLHLPSAALPVRAVVLSPACPPKLQQGDIARLSK